MLDLASLERLTARDPAVLRELLDELRRSLVEDLQHLMQLADGDDSNALRLLAHRVKGPARIVGAKRLIGACEALEQCCAARTPTAQPVQELRLAMEELSAWIERNS